MEILSVLHGNFINAMAKTMFIFTEKGDDHPLVLDV